MNKNKLKTLILWIVLTVLMICYFCLYIQNFQSNSFSFNDPLSMIYVAFAIAIGMCLILISRTVPKEKKKLIFWTKVLGLWNTIGGVVLEVVIVIIRLFNS